MRLSLLVTALTAVAGLGCLAADHRPELPPADGPVAAGYERGELCMPLPVNSSDATMGLDIFRNTGHKQATVTGVSAVEPKGLRIVEAVIVAIDGVSFGSSTAWPPRSAARSDLSKPWAARQPAVGYRLSPGNEQTHNLLVHVVKDAGAREATMHALRIFYTVDGRSYRVESTMGLTLKPTCLGFVGVS